MGPREAWGPVPPGAYGRPGPPGPMDGRNWQRMPFDARAPPGAYPPHAFRMGPGGPVPPNQVRTV